MTDHPLHPHFARRHLIAAGGVATVALLSLAPAANAADPGPDMAAARKEGPLVLWHGDQEGDVVEFIKVFTKKTGIEVVQQRLLPGAALPKLEAEFRAGNTDVDVYQTSDSGIMEGMRKKGQLQRYESAEISSYGADYRSDPIGYWTTYFINVGAIMYDPRYVTEAEAPKSNLDLLDAKWKGQVGYQNASSGSQYASWFLLKDILPKDYWDKLAAQKPRGYASSTQIITDIHRGDLKIGGRVSVFQYPKAVRANEPIKIVFPPEGAPAQNQVIGIIATTKRPNAARVYIDYLLSQEGQQAWNDIQGSYSAREGVQAKELPPMSSINIITPTAKNFAEYESEATHAAFVKLWNKVIGF